MRRQLLATLVAAGAIATGFSATATAQTAGEWNNGELTYTQGLAFNPFGPPTLQFVTGQFAGFQKRADGGAPRAGEVFYIHGVVSVVGTSADAPIMEFLIDEQLAPDMKWAISSKYPVRCYFRQELTGPKQDATSTCSQTPTPGTQGTFFGSRPLEPGQSFEVQVPVTVSKVKNGIGSGAAAEFGVLVRPANADPATASQHLFVAKAAPVKGESKDGGSSAPARRVVTALRVIATKRATGRRPRVLRFRLAKNAKVWGVIQRRTIRRTRGAQGAAARKVVWKNTRRIRPRSLRRGNRRANLGRLPKGRYRVILRTKTKGTRASAIRKAFAVGRR